jgi:hypothetical protein
LFVNVIDKVANCALHVYTRFAAAHAPHCASVVQAPQGDAPNVWHQLLQGIELRTWHIGVQVPNDHAGGLQGPVPAAVAAPEAPQAQQVVQQQPPLAHQVQQQVPDQVPDQMPAQQQQQPQPQQQQQQQQQEQQQQQQQQQQP